MDCSYIKNLIKQNTNLGISKFYCGRIDTKYEKSICVYDLQNEARQNIAVGGKENTTDYMKFTILIRWNDNYIETQQAAQSLYDYLTQCSHITFDNVDIYYIEMQTDNPIDLHCDNNGIYERSVDIKVYYKNSI